MFMQKENDDSNLFGKFQRNNVQIFFQNGDLKMSKNWKKVASIPSPSDFDGLPIPYFFIKMTTKDVKEITFMP